MSNVTNAAFEKYSSVYNVASEISPGSCMVGSFVISFTIANGLDPGSISLTGPSGSPLTLGPQFNILGAFTLNLGAGGIPFTGGSFTFTGSGGKDVGPFMTTVALANPLLTPKAKLPATADRTQGLQFSWTGGNPGTYVIISGSGAAAPLGTLVGYICEAPVDAGQFTIPPFVLQGLPSGTIGAPIQKRHYEPVRGCGLDIASANASMFYPLGTFTLK